MILLINIKGLLYTSPATVAWIKSIFECLHLYNTTNFLQQFLHFPHISTFTIVKTSYLHPCYCIFYIHFIYKYWQVISHLQLCILICIDCKGFYYIIAISYIVEEAQGETPDLWQVLTHLLYIKFAIRAPFFLLWTKQDSFSPL